MAQACELGGQLGVTAAAVQLDADTTPLRQLTIRSNTGNTVMYFGGSDVTSAPANAHGLLKADESMTWGPYESGFVRASNVYLSGTAADVLFWEGVRA